ncbi:tRNA 2-thiouridine(34) synthase MnmA [bacterium]|nr:tRNA 2-thiouridine(34) synthase MnmA [bacterium]
MSDSNRKRVLVAMSGGVDSSVAAALLAREGWEVIGATMRVVAGSESARCGSCCSPDDIHDARRVADAIGIPHYTFNVAERFEDEVVRPFAEAYLAGRTPIPCVACNDRMKFDWMLRRATELGCDALATGHYARVVDAGGTRRLLTGVDRDKDQSYFLFTINATQLDRLIFPIGHLVKDEVRRLAAELRLPVAEKPESQDICFVPSGRYDAVVARFALANDGAGDIVDTHGNLLGRHDGYHLFTVGQRKGLGSFGPEPHYVVRIDATDKRVVVGHADETFAAGLACESFRWVNGAPDTLVRGVVKIRHRHPGVAATITPDGDGVVMHFDAPARAVAPGQAAVVYTGDVVLGGGFIDRAILSESADASGNAGAA